MPRGIPNKKPEETNGQKISKMEAMRRAIGEKGAEAKPLDLQPYLKSKFGIEMNTDLISNYKGLVLKELAEKGAVTAPSKAQVKPAATPAPKAQAKLASGFSLDELEAVKALSDKIGAEKVKQLAHALSK